MARKVAYRHSIKISSMKWKIILVMIYLVKFTLCATIHAQKHSELTNHTATNNVYTQAKRTNKS